MAKFESSNPLLNVERIERSSANVSSEVGTMTLEGTAKKSAFLIALCAITAAMSGAMVYYSHNIALGTGMSVVVAIGALVAYLIAAFKPTTAFICAPIYALLEGALLGNISGIAELAYPGVVAYALIGTVATAGVMFVGFSYGIFKVTQKFRSIIMCMVAAFAITYVIQAVMMLFGYSGFSVLSATNTSWLSFVISGVAIIVAACCLLLDFDNIAQLHGNASKHYEWVCGMGLLATLIWLYIELLKLAIKIKSLMDE